MGPKALGGLVAAHLVASAVHFADNVIRFELYPEPLWLSAGIVAAAWFLLAALALIGLRLVRRARPGAWALLASSFLAIAGIGHYLVPGGAPMDPFMQASIWLEAAAAAALAVGAVLGARRASG